MPIIPSIPITMVQALSALTWFSSHRHCLLIGPSLPRCPLGTLLNLAARGVTPVLCSEPHPGCCQLSPSGQPGHVQSSLIVFPYLPFLTPSIPATLASWGPLNHLGTLLPQGLGTCHSLCLKHPSRRLKYSLLPLAFHAVAQMSPSQRGLPVSTLKLCLFFLALFFQRTLNTF